jgi:fatty acid desaturase
MKFYVKDSLRKTDPAPVKTNAKLVFTVGLVLWVLALVAVLAFYPALTASEQALWPYTCAVGIILGIIGLIRVRNR